MPVRVVRSYGVAAAIRGVFALDGLMSDMMNDLVYRARWNEMVVGKSMCIVLVAWYFDGAPCLSGSTE